ncbi:hypothetical protein ACWD1Z_37785 [Streptomyces sp. NPDC002784]
MRDYDLLPNIVVPVVKTSLQPDGVRSEGFAGTAFLLQHGQGLAMTARHVADELTSGEAAVLFRGTDGAWQPAAVQGIEPLTPPKTWHCCASSRTRTSLRAC